MLSAGIDIGSINTKVAVVNHDRCLVAQLVRPTGHKPRESGPAVFEACLREAGVERSALDSVTATGYARHTVDFADNSVTEIRAAALGVRHWHPECRSIVDIGGQDSKVLVLDDAGRVNDFAMNDRCAAGTGNFLAVLAEKLAVPIDEFGPLALQSRKPVAISSLCVVMAESEILSLVAAETRVEDIIAGLHFALARRIANMAAALDVRSELVFTGGVAQNDGMARALESAFGFGLTVARMPLLAAALGAALVDSR